MKIDFKSVVIGIVIGSMGLTTAYSTSKSKTIDVYETNSLFTIQDEPITIPKENELFVYNEMTYAPIRAIVESMGGSASFRKDTNTIEIYSTDKAKVRLLKEAVQTIGAASPEKAIDIWAKGVKERNAALQYCVMTEAFKEIYVKSLEENDYDFWVTGVSSPWVENYEILKINEIKENTFEYELKFNTKTSDEDYHFLVTPTVIKEGDYWKISNIRGNSDSEAYTGFKK